MDNPMQSSWCRGLAIAHSMPRCGAKARTRNYLPCQNAAMTNGRCRMHGGKSTGAPCGSEHWNYRHGIYVKDMVMIKKQHRQLLGAAKEILAGL